MSNDTVKMLIVGTYLLLTASLIAMALVEYLKILEVGDDIF